ncbi:MAG: cyanophycinase [Parvularculaceae bacterium]|nr:cyanophycinase [Parvularculaceae bacterium]
MRFLSVAASLFVLLLSVAQAAGRLVIAGGAIRQDNSAVWQAFTEALPAEGTVFVVGGASGEPHQSAEAAKQALIRFGLSADRLKTAPLAVKDDPSTKGVNEARWSKNGRSAGLAAEMNSAAGVWFTGGDQTRLTQLLLQRNGSDTPVLAAIREAREAGAVIGGTSAGAAMMSDPMITGGNSLDALLGRGEQVSVDDGLGFLNVGVTDQHFGERARLGRLIRALSSLPEANSRIGFGVDEGTALVVDGGSFSVVGEGYVTVIEATSASFDLVRGRIVAEDMIIHLLSHGDRILEGGAIAAAGYKKATRGNEYYDRNPAGGGGMAVPGSSLADVIGDDLLDNEGARSASRVSFGGNGQGVRYRFQQSQNSTGFWGRGPDGRARYTVTGVEMAVEPVDVEIKDVR